MNYDWDLLTQNMTYGGITIDDVTFYVYNRKNTGGTKVTHNTVSVLKNAGFDASKETIIFIHGYYSSAASKPFPVDTTGLVLRLNDWNIINVDWEPVWKNNGAGIVMSNLGNVGGFIGSFVSAIQKEFGLNLDKLQIIGHSVGGHLTGTAGNALKGAVKSIVGLDPANVVGVDNHVNRISTSSGKYVEVSTHH